jgi:hypothetical protein
VHALLDGELDAGHARELEAHLEGLLALQRCSRLFATCGRPLGPLVTPW